MRYALFLTLTLLASGCASTGDSFVFRERPAPGPVRSEVTVTSRILPLEEARAECYMRNRLAGVIVKLHPNAPACSWREADGRVILVWANPGSFNNKIGMESGGHELFHWHEVVEHD